MTLPLPPKQKALQCKVPSRPSEDSWVVGKHSGVTVNWVTLVCSLRNKSHSPVFFGGGSNCFFLRVVETKWTKNLATRFKTSYFPLNPGCLIPGSYILSIDGLWNNPSSSAVFHPQSHLNNQGGLISLRVFYSQKNRYITPKLDRFPKGKKNTHIQKTPQDVQCIIYIYIVLVDTLRWCRCI